ncbi:hypothetical protein LWI29_020225 [Acer saccharum]|uniref:Uncharacterized protein n=1 Tax=Acer saccharum TaxID=4024 RepID=A0AA39RN82_ACESA|nr:hypothetical protein LWI29_020225 [Acer saccharum]
MGPEAGDPPQARGLSSYVQPHGVGMKHLGSMIEQSEIEEETPEEEMPEEEERGGPTKELEEVVIREEDPPKTVKMEHDEARTPKRPKKEFPKSDPPPRHNHLPPNCSSFSLPILPPNRNWFPPKKSLASRWVKGKFIASINETSIFLLYSRILCYLLTRTFMFTGTTTFMGKNFEVGRFCQDYICLKDLWDSAMHELLGLESVPGEKFRQEVLIPWREEVREIRNDAELLDVLAEFEQSNVSQIHFNVNYIPPAAMYVEHPNQQSNNNPNKQPIVNPIQ